MRTHAVIMAGGSGTRFWPLSRADKPKQYLEFADNKPMINDTINRLKSIMPPEDIFVISTKRQKEILNNAIGTEIPVENIYYEPASKNTMPCIGLMAFVLKRKFSEDDVMCVLPSDHYIKKTDKYNEILIKAIQAAETTNHLITIGIVPTYPCTGYGYIYAGTETMIQDTYHVRQFVEKPDIIKANKYFQSRNYLWNSGMFVWKISAILNEFKKQQPLIYSELEKIGNSIGTSDEEKVLLEIYSQMQNISIDYGIMEKSSNVLVIPGEFGWNDIGSWEALDTFFGKDAEDNIVIGDHVTLDVKNCILYGKDHTIAAIGLEDVIIVHSHDATLVCHKNRAQDVKKALEKLDKIKDRELL